MSALRTFPRLPTEVWYVQDMLQDAGPRRENSRRQESQLVIEQSDSLPFLAYYFASARRLLDTLTGDLYSLQAGLWPASKARVH